MLIIKGQIEKGRGLGKKLGFPTINVPYDGGESGVFAGQVWIDGLLYKAAVHLGPRPTVNDDRPICEAFLLDWQGGDLAGKEVKISLVERIREIEKFENLDALQFQIAKDVELIKNLLK